MMVHKSFLKENKNEIYAIISLENQALLLKLTLCLTELKHVPKYSISDDTSQTVFALLQT